jgi:isoleucyl-tRNA synthetase
MVTRLLKDRADAGIKVRQPLSKVVSDSAFHFNPQLIEVLKDELNVKEVAFKGGQSKFNGIAPGTGSARIIQSVTLDTTITPELKAEGTMRDIVRLVQSARKNAGLEVDDRITLTLETEDAHLAEAIVAHADVIKTETLATELLREGATDVVPSKVNGAELYIKVEKT